MQRTYALVGIVALAWSFGCRGSSDASTTKWETGGATHRGHEDITRYGVEHANAQLAGVTGDSEFFPKPAKGVAGIDSGNPIIRGNFETDFPQKKFLDFYQAENPVPVIGWVDWHNSPRLQHLHGLRNRDEQGFLDPFATCRQSSQAIAQALMQALPRLRQDPHSASGLHWLGHATHMIQDTFSTAHAIRDGKLLTDHCTYGVRDARICYHEESDERDRIWHQDNGSCEFDPNNRNWACLVSEAKSASLASAGFLTLAGRLTLDHSLATEMMIQQWLQGHDGLYESGYFDCRPMGERILNDFYRFIAGDDLLPSERALLQERLSQDFIPELKDYLFDKYGPTIINTVADGILDDDLMARYLPALREQGYEKLSARIFVDDAIEHVKRRVLSLTGREVDAIRLPFYSSYLMRVRSLRKLDEQIQNDATQMPLPQPKPIPDPCLERPTPIDVLKCHNENIQRP